VGADQKEAPLPGLNQKASSSNCYSDGRSRAAAAAFAASLLFTFEDETGLLDEKRAAVDVLGKAISKIVR
jgi:hypothetical protein